MRSRILRAQALHVEMRMDEMDRKIRDARRRLRMTQGEFASALGVTQSTVSRWESGAQSPDLPATVKLAELVGASPSELIGSASKGLQTSTSASQKKIYISGYIDENTYTSEPDVGGSDFVVIHIESYSFLVDNDVTAFEIIDASGLPYFGLNSVVIAVRGHQKLAESDMVVITVSDNGGRYRTLIKRVYYGQGGNIRLASLNPDPAYYSSFDLKSDTEPNLIDPSLSVDLSCVRGVVVASLTKYRPGRIGL